MSERASRQQKAKQRLSAALRENLRRRKAQTKARMADATQERQDLRSAGPVDELAAKPHDSAGFDDEK